MDIKSVDKNMSNKNIKEDNSLIFLDPKNSKYFYLSGFNKDNIEFARFTLEEFKLIDKSSKDVSWLAHHSSGISLRFYTDSSQIVIKGKNQEMFEMNNMNMISQCGFALYYFDKEAKIYRHHNSLRFDHGVTKYNANILNFQKRELREYILYFPLYMGVKELEIGLDKDSIIKPYIYENKIKIGIYGTSIAQGCSASQPGLCYSNIMSRKLNAEIFNFGFSGNALLHKEIAEILGKRKLDILLMDVEPNAGMSDILKLRIAEFLNIYFSFMPKGKVIYASRPKLGEDHYKKEQDELRKFYYEYIPPIISKFKNEGYDISYFDGSNIYKESDLEFSPDTLHPDDYGMKLLADNYINLLKGTI